MTVPWSEIEKMVRVGSLLRLPTASVTNPSPVLDAGEVRAAAMSSMVGVWVPLTDGKSLASLRWRTRVLLMPRGGVVASMGEWVRAPMTPFPGMFACECGWFGWERFSHYAVVRLPTKE